MLNRNPLVLAALAAIALTAPTIANAQDRDGDGVLDAQDVCPDTRSGRPVDSAGCDAFCEVVHDAANGSAFLRSRLLEVGTADWGSFGTVNPPPLGWHPRNPDNPNQFGFVANPADDDWVDYKGDFFVPGSPEEGFGMTVGGNDYFTSRLVGERGIEGDFTGVRVECRPRVCGLRGGGSVYWAGSRDGIDIQQVYSVFNEGVFILIQVTLTNTTPTTQTVYYMRNVDPDNMQPVTGDFSTLNRIVSQGDGTDTSLALVSATTSAPDSYIGLGSSDPDARVTFGGFSNRDADGVWSCSPADFSASCTPGDEQFDDIAISIAFRKVIPPGESRTFSYVYTLGAGAIGESIACTTPSACGDGVVEGTEACDDGNRTNGDGCDNTCDVEPGWECTGSPSRCTEICAGCTIGATCIPAGTLNPSNPCLVCRPATSTTTWSPVSAGATCNDGQFCTVSDACNGAGTCTGAARNCGDGLSCTTDSCDEAADVCRNVVSTGCLIDGACVAAAAPRPGNVCLVCAPGTSTTAWSPASLGTTCNDGQFCTVSDACNGAGACTGTARNCSDGLSCTSDSCDEAADVCRNVLSAGCVIDGMCVPSGTPSPTNACLVCAPGTSTTTWSPASAGASCDDGQFCTVSDACNGAGACTGTARNCSDGLSCTADSCDEALDLCVSTLAEGCFIDGACVAEGTLDPANACMTCAPEVSTSEWSPASAGSECDDGLFCTVDDACDGAGACGSVARDCSDGIDCTLDLCDETAASCESRVVETCRIDGMCVPETTRNPLNACEVCDPARTTDTWSPIAAGTGCDDGAFCTVEDACDGEGLCVGAERSCDDDRSCTADACDEAASSCTNTLAEGCLVDGSCVADGEASPDDDCQVCDSTLSDSSYSPSDAPACRPDAGAPDAGGPQEDASLRPDAGASFRVRGGGCGCHAVGATPSRAWVGGLLLLGLGLVVRRRRR